MPKKPLEKSKKSCYKLSMTVGETQTHLALHGLLWRDFARFVRKKDGVVIFYKDGTCEPGYHAEAVERFVDYKLLKKGKK